MYRFLNDKFSSLILSVALIITAIVGFPSAAHAIKAPKAIAFDPAATSINVATVYETTIDTQKSLIKSLKSNKAIKSAAGFSNFSMLKSEDGTRLVTLSQWKDLESYQAYAAPAEAGEKSAKAVPAPARSLIYKIEKAQTARAGLLPAVKGKQAVVQFTEFKLKSPDDQATVIAGLEKLIPSALLKQPAPQSVVLFRSTDNTDVALLANWNCTADFTEGEKPAEFDAPDATIAALIEPDQHLYDVIRIMPASEKKKSDDY